MSDKSATQFEGFWRNQIASEIGAKWAEVCIDDHDPDHCLVCRDYRDAQRVALGHL